MRIMPVDQHIVMQIAVAQMPEAVHPRARGMLVERLPRLDQELRDRGNGNGHVMFDAFAFLGLGFGDALAQHPQIGRLPVAFRDGAVQHASLPESFFE